MYSDKSTTPRKLEEKRLTWTESSEDLVSECSEFTELLHSKAVLAGWLAGDTVQLGGVRQPDTDGVDVDAFCSGLFRFRNGSAGVDVGHTVSYHDANVGNVGTVAVGSGEHLRSHGVEGVGSVGAAVTVGDVVDGFKNVDLGGVGVQLELYVVFGAVDDDTHAHIAVVDVGDEEEVLDEVFHQFEVGSRDTGGGVQNKHQIDLGLVTTCERNFTGCKDMLVFMKIKWLDSLE